MENKELNQGQPQGNESGTQPEKPYKTFTSKDELTNYINSALQNKEKRIKELETESKKFSYSKNLNDFDPKLQELLLGKLDFSKNDEDIKKDISALKEEYKEFINDESNSNISFLKQDKPDNQEESYIDKILKVDIG